MLFEQFIFKSGFKAVFFFHEKHGRMEEPRVQCGYKKGA